MLTLFTSGPRFGLPDASPFVCKALVLLRMSGLAYTVKAANFMRAPKGKIPYIADDGALLGDSTLIRWHLENAYGVDFDTALSVREKGIAWAVEKMVEEHLYFAVVHARWTDDANFARGPRSFFESFPAFVRPIVTRLVRRKVRQALVGQGMGRHTRAEVVRFALADLDAVAAILGDKPWLMGSEPCGADASVWAAVAAALCPLFETGIRAAGERHPTLVAYRDRGLQRWFPELAT